MQRLTSELEDHRRLIDQRQAAYRDGQLQLNRDNQQIESHKVAILDLMRKLAQVNSRLGAIEIERRNIVSHQSRLSDRRQVVLAELETLEAQRVEEQGRLDQAAEHVKNQQAMLEARRAEAQQLGKQISQLSEALGTAKEHRSGLLSRQKLLKDLEARREGVSEGVKSVLRQREQKFPFVRGLVADFLRVDVEHAHVIEAALDGRDQWLITEDSAALFAAQNVLGTLEGRVNVLCADVIRGDARMFRSPGGVVKGGADIPVCFESVSEGHSCPSEPIRVGSAGQECPTLADSRQTGMSAPPENPPRLDPSPADAHADIYNWNRHPQRIRIAADLVRADNGDDAIARHLLGRTAVVDTLADAVELHRAGPRGWRYVTHAGQVLEADGTVRAGPLTASMGLLSRRSELDALVQQLAEVERRIALLTRQLTDGNAAARSLEEQQNALRNEIYRANTVKVELSSKISQIADRQSSLSREQPVLDRELQNLLDQTGKLKTEETGLLEKRQTFDADQATRQQQIDELSAAQKLRAEEIRHLAEQLTTSRVQLGMVQEKQLASQQGVQRLTSARRVAPAVRAHEKERGSGDGQAGRR